MAAVINSLIIILFIYLFIYLELGLLTVPGTWSVESDSISYVCSAVANKGKKKKGIIYTPHWSEKTIH